MIFGWELLLWRRPSWESLPIPWIFFSLKWIWFLSPWEDGVKCSLVILWCTPRDTFRDAKGWEIPKHHFIHQQWWNSTERKKKSHWVSPPPALLLPSFIRLILILPMESQGKSLVATVKRGWLGQHSHGEPKPEANPKGWGAGSAPAELPRYLNRSLSTSAKVPLKGSKMPFPKHSLLLQLLPTLHFQGKKGNKIGNRG